MLHTRHCDRGEITRLSSHPLHQANHRVFQLVIILFILFINFGEEQVITVIRKLNNRKRLKQQDLEGLERLY